MNYINPAAWTIFVVILSHAIMAKLVKMAEIAHNRLYGLRVRKTVKPSSEPFKANSNLPHNSGNFWEKIPMILSVETKKKEGYKFCTRP